MKILVLNAGSSSVKYKLLQMPGGVVIAGGSVSGIKESEGQHVGEYCSGKATRKVRESAVYRNHNEAFKSIVDRISEGENPVIRSMAEINAVGHRVVHGGELFKKPTLITVEVKDQIKTLFPLAPLHNPANLEGIMMAEKFFPSAPQFAVFDTTFHSSIPDHASHYAIPYSLASDEKIRVYGFHGTSHQYVVEKTLQVLGASSQGRVISVHLGNGCSMACSKNGVCLDTSMGFGPLAGLMMGTRSGDVDPSVIFYLHDKGYDMSSIRDLLNSKSGLLGVAGDNDLRRVIDSAQEGNKSAKLAIRMYCYRIKKYIGQYTAVLGGLDALVFTAGVGENSALIRSESCEGLECFGVEINEHSVGITHDIIDIGKGKVKVLVVPTNEELEIARQGYSLLCGKEI